MWLAIVLAGNVSALAPVLAMCALGLSAICIVAIVCWYRARDKELQIQREMRIREIEHQQKMRQLDVEAEKAKAAQIHDRTA
jgi:choline-glycine betaine transporter